MVCRSHLLPGLFSFEAYIQELALTLRFCAARVTRLSRISRTGADDAKDKFLRKMLETKVTSLRANDFKARAIYLYFCLLALFSWLDDLA